jgi:LmbE family N-acetylglucosaminyl deacetylase
MNVLVVAAHPDDEVLGCGGAIARHAAAGDRVRILILAEGATSRHAEAGAHAAEVSALRAEVEFESFADNRMDAVPRLKVVRAVERRIAEFAPRRVYTHHAGDVNVDHQVAHHAVVTACRPQPGHPVRELLFFEVASSSEWQPPGSGLAFAPSVFIDIGARLAAKRAALAAYAAELRPWPHPRSVEAVEHLARWRGASVGLEAAEAFMPGRRIETD